MKIQLTISMLVSDRMDTLEKSLNSIRPLLTELTCELIIVYTGNNPDTLELAKKYASHIIPFTWCNDFSKARNVGIQEAKGEWFLYLDDDEWFEDVTEIVDFFKSGEYMGYQSAMYVQRNYNDWEGRSFVDANVGRMCRMMPETRFIYPIHENLSPFAEPCRQFRSYVHHFGYVGREGDLKAAPKFERNISLLLKLYEEKPTAQNCTQLVQEYKSVDDYETAIRYCREGLTLAAKEKRIHTYELWMQVQLPLLLSFSGDKEAALREGERLIAQPRTLEVGRAHLSGFLAGICWELKEYKKGLAFARQYRKEMVYLGRHPDTAERQNGITVTYASAGERAVTTYVAGLLCASAMGETSLIGELLSWIPWDEEEKVISQYGNLEIWKDSYKEQKEDILKGFWQVRSDNSYVLLQKVYYAEYMQKSEEMERLFRLCSEHCPVDFRYQLVEISVKNGISLNLLLEYMTAEEWDECADIVAERVDISEVVEFSKRLRQVAGDYPIYSERLIRRLLKKQIMQDGQGDMAISQLLGLLVRYCECVVTEAKLLFKDEILTDPDFYALPGLYKFAFAMRRALDAFGEEDYIGCIPFLEKAVHICPEMSGIIGRLSEYIQEQTAEPKQPASDEFVLLGMQVKQVLAGLIENEQWGEAYGVVNQLVTLLPDDLEILKYKQEIVRHMN